MKKSNKTGILVDGSLRSAGVTFYTKKGKTIVRSATSNERRSMTIKQFIVRQKRMHANILWHTLRVACRNLFTTGTTAYGAFCAMATKLPPVYISREDYLGGFSCLMPGIPVSSGTLPNILLTLGSVDGRPALLTDLTPDALGDDTLTLFELRQCVSGDMLRLDLMKKRMKESDFELADGRLALVGDRYGDTLRGWALVRQRRASCSTQTIVTACDLYLPYLTDDALLRAAESFGGLTPDRIN